VRIEVLDPIAPGLPREEFFERLQEQVEGSSNRLLEEGRKELGLGPASSSEASLSKA
jgi:1-acyl-sn-glycerol-3-phosphate acyltransferase